MNSRQDVFASACLFVLLSFSFLFSQTETQYAEISLDSVSVTAGDTAVVNLTVHSHSNMSCFSFDITEVPSKNIEYIGSTHLGPSKFANASQEVRGVLKVLYFGPNIIIDTARTQLIQYRFLIDKNAPSQTIGLTMSNGVAYAIGSNIRVPLLFTDGAITVEASSSTPTQLDPWALGGSIYAGINSEIFVVSSIDSAIIATTLEMHFDSNVLEYAGSVDLIGRASDMSVTAGKIGDPETGVRMVIYSLQDGEIEAGSGYIAKVSLKAKDGVVSGTTTQIYLTHKSLKDTLATSEFTITGSGGSPFFYDLEAQQLTVGNDFFLQLDAIDPEGGALTYSIKSFDYPGDYLFFGSTGQFLWTPTKTGNYVAEFAVSDGVNESSQIVTFEVLVGNVPPEWQSEVVEIAAAEGQLLTYVFDPPTDFNQDALTITSSGLPENSSFDPSTLNFSWTPGLEDAGEYTFTLVAADPDGEEDYLYAVVTVENTNLPPEIILENNAYQIDQEQALSLQVIRRIKIRI
ncbi:MAG: hypothetical protein HOC71_00670 [Candidatus Latescibacteria bacterium]|jgi:hypothetical protein|nr:hypothetical protein [Candidatus Latescibacterota bacterium]